jgi:hypothetical protein
MDMPTHWFRNMRTRTALQLGRAGAVLLCLLLAVTNLHAAGIVDFVDGEVRTQLPDGTQRVLRVGDRVVAGETLRTPSGAELHLRMDDGALVAMRPNTQLVIEAYGAAGDADRDRAVLRLEQGAVRVLSGFIARFGDRKSELQVGRALLRFAETDVEARVSGRGEASQAWFRAYSGAAVASSDNGQRIVRPDQPVQVGNDGIPVPGQEGGFAAATHDARLRNQQPGHAESVQQRLNAAAEALARSGGLDNNSAERIPKNCTPSGPVGQALEAATKAYLSGNPFELQNRLDVSLMGRQQIIDAAREDQLRLRQRDLRFSNLQMQCGPHVAVIQASWEKRYLDAQSFQPGLLQGRASLLFQLRGSSWRVSALAGDNPFGGASGSLARLVFSGPVTFGSATAVLVQLSDADRVNQAGVNVQLTTNQGDSLNLPLGRVGPGQFQAALPLGAGPANPGNGTLEVSPGVQIYARFADDNPGDGRAGTVVIATTNVGGALDTTPNPFAFAPVPFACINNPTAFATSAPVVVAGINAPAPVSITDVGLAAFAQYSINGGPFTSVAGTITNGQSVQVRAQPGPGATAGPLVRANLNIGGVQAAFTLNCS